MIMLPEIEMHLERLARPCNIITYQVYSRILKADLRSTTLVYTWVNYKVGYSGGRHRANPGVSAIFDHIYIRQTR